VSAFKVVALADRVRFPAIAPLSSLADCSANLKTKRGDKNGK